jgi:hypothetical protein
MGVQWIERNGKRILYVDHRHSSSDQIIENIKTSEKMVASMTGGLRTYANFEGAIVDKEVMQHLKKSGAEVFEPITQKQAIVGVKGIRHVLLQAYNMFTGGGQHQQLFESEEEALAWLAAD